MPSPFVAAVLDGPIGAEDWRAWLKRNLAEFNVHLCDDSQIRCGTRILGPYQLLDAAQAKLEFGGRPWFSLSPLLPRLGKPVGFLTWTHIGDEELAIDQLIPALMRRARGFIARRDNDQVKYPVSLREFSLDNLVNRHGFHDGDVFLDRTKETLTDVATQAEFALSAAGLEAHVGVFGTHHNPVRISGDLRCRGEVVDDARAALEPIYIAMLVYDWSIVDDDLFWME